APAVAAEELPVDGREQAALEPGGARVVDPARRLKLVAERVEPGIREPRAGLGRVDALDRSLHVEVDRIAVEPAQGMVGAHLAREGVGRVQGARSDEVETETRGPPDEAPQVAEVADAEASPAAERVEMRPDADGPALPDPLRDREAARRS